MDLQRTAKVFWNLQLSHWDFFQCILAFGFFGTTPLLLISWLHELLLLCCWCCLDSVLSAMPPFVPSIMPRKALTQHWHCGSLLCNVNTHKEKACKEGLSDSEVSFAVEEGGGKLFCLVMLLKSGCSYLLFSIPFFVFIFGNKGRAFCVQTPVTSLLLMGLGADGWLNDKEIGWFWSGDWSIVGQCPAALNDRRWQKK